MNIFCANTKNWLNVLCDPCEEQQTARSGAEHQDHVQLVQRSRVQSRDPRHRAKDHLARVVVRILELKKQTWPDQAKLYLHHVRGWLVSEIDGLFFNPARIFIRDADRSELLYGSGLRNLEILHTDPRKSKFLFYFMFNKIYLCL